MDYQALADLLFPNVTETPEEVEGRFPKRQVPEGAVITRMAPSPTGFVHLGNLVQGLTLYFGIPFVQPEPVRYGVVATQQSPLMLRNYPSLDADIIARIPKGTRLPVYGTVGDWYVVFYQGLGGYVYSQYIALEQ